MYVIRIPKSVEKIFIIAKENKNSFYLDAIREEMVKLKGIIRIHERELDELTGFQKLLVT